MMDYRSSKNWSALIKLKTWNWHCQSNSIIAGNVCCDHLSIWALGLMCHRSASGVSRGRLSQAVGAVFRDKILSRRQLLQKLFVLAWLWVWWVRECVFSGFNFEVVGCFRALIWVLCSFAGSQQQTWVGSEVASLPLVPAPSLPHKSRLTTNPDQLVNQEQPRTNRNSCQSTEFGCLGTNLAYKEKKEKEEGA